ncbi:MAG TPA: hypothetical protein VOB72_04370 [Candidatus Dormibacteraeota bacterium]|nr:hypothetical protein [Candidatus Dormibacteraeota bacterium]
MTEPGGVVRGPADLAPLLAIAERLVGAPCWNAAFSYGDELYLDLGGRRAYRAGPMAGRQYGEWQLYTRGSRWRLVDGDGIELATDERERSDSEPALRAIVGAPVALVSIDQPDLDLLVEFDNGCRLHVRCAADEDDLECWSLVAPEGQVLDARPGGSWSVGPYETT